jgi:hypothetical protein
MAQVTYRITLSVSGDHAVSVSGDDPVAVNDGLAWARGIYLKLKERAEPSLPTSSTTPPVDHHDHTPPEPAPMCAIHHRPMVQVQGSKGTFWSCHAKLEDGSWCPYRPPK